MEFKKNEIFLIPNILTYIRIICVPFFIWMMFTKLTEHGTLIAFGIFLFATITDLADGKIARKYNMVSDIGKVLDPFADKFLQVSAVVCLSIKGNLYWIFVVILFVKEAYMIICASAIIKKVGKDVEIKANFYGKIAAFANAIGISLSFFHNIKGAHHLYYIDWVFMGIGSILTILAAIMYTIQVSKKVREALNKNKESK